MSMATTPCPPWCTADHNLFRSHDRTVGDVNGIRVMAFQYADEPPSISVVNDRYRPKTAHPSERLTVVKAKQAPAVAALLEALGEHLLADMVRVAANIIRDGAR